MKYAVLFVFFSAAIAVGQDRAEPGHPKHIVGGEDVTDGNEFPFVAKILYYGGSYTGCTGALIAPDKVLTAGHCVLGYSDLAVGFGDRRSSGAVYPVVEAIPHHDIHPGYQQNDIAVLRLESDIPIRPVNVLTLEEELRYAPSGSRSGVAVGWGSRLPKDGDDFSDTLQKVTGIPIYTHEDCQRVIDDLYSQRKAPGPPSIHERVLCAGEEGRAIGAGDSGGPLLVDTPKGWGLVGVLSQATHDDFQNIIYMGQWTRTSYYLDWVYTASPALPTEWLEEDNGQYTIYYVQEYEQDVEFVRTWMDRAERLMLDKYGLQRHGYDISVYLPPAPTSYAGRGLSTLVCCRSDGTGEIHYLTPSAPAYGEGSLGTLRLSANDYHSKTLVHEYVTVAHQRVSENKPRGFSYYSAPSWFYQGLEEYDGMFHSTESNRTTGYERLLDYAEKSLQGTFYNFGSSSPYFGGLLLQTFLVEQYGEDIHLDLLTSEQPTFDLALDEQLARHGRTASEAFEDFQRWFQAKLSGGIGTVPAAKPFNLYFAHSAAGGGWRTDLMLLNTNPEWRKPLWRCSARTEGHEPRSSSACGS